MLSAQQTHLFHPPEGRSEVVEEADDIGGHPPHGEEDGQAERGQDREEDEDRVAPDEADGDGDGESKKEEELFDGGDPHGTKRRRESRLWIAHGKRVE